MKSLLHLTRDQSIKHLRDLKIDVREATRTLPSDLLEQVINKLLIPSQHISQMYVVFDTGYLDRIRSNDQVRDLLVRSNNGNFSNNQVRDIPPGNHWHFGLSDIINVGDDCECYEKLEAERENHPELNELDYLPRYVAGFSVGSATQIVDGHHILSGYTDENELIDLATTLESTGGLVFWGQTYRMMYTVQEVLKHGFTHCRSYCV